MEEQMVTPEPESQQIKKALKDRTYNGPEEENGEILETQRNSSDGEQENLDQRASNWRLLDEDI